MGLLAWTADLAPAQQHEPTAAAGLTVQEKVPDAIIPIHRAEDDEIGGRYGIWAGGRDYKVAFHDQPTFIPYLGGGYPTTQHLGFTTRSITVDGVDILHGPRGVRERREVGEARYEYLYGEVIEAYDVRVEGLEQTFTFPTRLPPGDLEVRIGLNTSLHVQEVRGTSATVALRDDAGAEILEYGEGVVLDAAGRRGAVRTIASADEIRLQVNAQWLAQAKYPVVIDPLVRVRVLATGATFSAMDTFSAPAEQAVFTAYSRFASTTDEDVVMRRHQLNLNTSTLSFSDITSNWSTQHPSVTGVGTSPGKVIVAFNRRFANVTSAIRIHQRDASDTTPSTAVSFISNPSGFQTWKVDLGGAVMNAAGSKVLMVFQMEPGTMLFNSNSSRIGARVIDATPTQTTVGAPFVLPTFSTRTTRDADFPSVNQVARQNGSLTTWVVVWQEWDVGVSNEDWDLVGRQVVATGFVSPSAWTSFSNSNAPTSHRTAPKIAGTNNGRYAVTYARSLRTDVPFKSGQTNGHALDFERLDWPDGFSPRRYRPVTIEGYSSSRCWQPGAISYDPVSNSHWPFTYRCDRDNGGDGEVHVTLVGYDGGALQRHSIPTPAPGQGFPGGVTYDTNNFVFHVGYGAGAANDARIAVLEYERPTPDSTAGFACSTATINWTGRGLQGQAAGSEFLGPRVQNAPANAVHFMILSLGAVDQFPGPRTDPGCRRLVSVGPGYLGIFPIMVGANVQWPLPLPTNVTAGLTLHFQDWHTNPAQTRFQSTQRLSVPIGR